MILLVILILILYSIVLSVGLARYKLAVSAPAKVGTRNKPCSRVLIVGATGGTGRQLVVQALDRGLEVTVLVRNPSSLKVEDQKLRVVRGNVLDYSAVEAAVQGQDAIVSALGHKRFFYPTHILSAATGNLLKAMESHGVPRLVCETSLGIGSSVGRLGIFYTFFIIPVILPLYFWDKTRQEQIIAHSKMEWVIVRPGILTNAKRKGTYCHGPKIGNFLCPVRISRADVAEFMLNQLTDDTYLATAVGVAD